MDRFEGMEIDVNRDKPRGAAAAAAPMPPPPPPAAPALLPPVATKMPQPPQAAAEMLRQQIKMGAALKRAQDARLAQLKRQVDQARRDITAVSSGGPAQGQRRSELQHELASLESLLAVRQQYVDECTRLREQGRNPDLAALIFYQGLDAYCGDEDQYNPHIRREYRYVGRRGTVEQQDLELLEIAKNLVAQPGIRTFADYTQMFPHLLANHCADDEEAKTDFVAKERLRKEAETNAKLRAEQQEWWQRTGAKSQLKTWWLQTAWPLIEREKATSNYDGKAPRDQAKLAQRILKSVGMSLSQSWLREKNTSLLGPYPPFWATLVETGHYKEAGSEQPIHLADILPNWDWKAPPETDVAAADSDAKVMADVGGSEALRAMVERLRTQNNDLQRQLAEQRLDVATQVHAPMEALVEGRASDTARRIKEAQKSIARIDKRLAKSSTKEAERDTLYVEREQCVDILRDTMDLVQNKYARVTLIS